MTIKSIDDKFKSGNGLLEYKYIDWYVDVLQEALRGGE